jgi:hypothetical protein
VLQKCHGRILEHGFDRAFDSQESMCSTPLISCAKAKVWALWTAVGSAILTSTLLIVMTLRCPDPVWTGLLFCWRYSWPLMSGLCCRNKIADLHKLSLAGLKKPRGAKSIFSGFDAGLRESKHLDHPTHQRVSGRDSPTHRSSPHSCLHQNRAIVCVIIAALPL